ncbi:hypothetical protein [Nocardioides sp.]|uniref:hypothetical protein n=1 Tax=Nocardioides sp. TaxID=35761 RepID=UPI00286D17B0|nr:hypothetical protein [Nocardioides sp.]
MIPLEQLITEQAGLLARRQLTAHGLDWGRVRNQIAAHRWVEVTPRVVCTTTGRLTPEQRRWMAVLHAGPRSMIGGLTAAEVQGLKRWERDEVCVLVDDELSFEPVKGVRFFRSRRPYELLRSPRPGLPRCQLEPAVLLWAGYDAAIRPAHGVLAAVVQQRLTTPGQLLSWLDQLTPLRRAKGFRATLGDIAVGGHSLAELAVDRMCRRFGLPLPRRQTRRQDSSGVDRWTDCEWDLPDGTVLVLEVDGSFHLDVVQWQDDLRRTRRITAPGRVVVRCTAYELRHEADEVAVDLVALGLPGRVPQAAA